MSRIVSAEYAKLFAVGRIDRLDVFRGNGSLPFPNQRLVKGCANCGRARSEDEKRRSQLRSTISAIRGHTPHSPVRTRARLRNISLTAAELKEIPR